MDTSKEYITMCEGVEIQKMWKPVNGDWYYNKRRETIIIIGGWLKSRTTEESFNNNLHIFLPRQDQLQEIYGLEGDNFFSELTHFKNSIAELRRTGYETMEQLWLAFVMKEKFNKTWNREEWVEE